MLRAKLDPGGLGGSWVQEGFGERSPPGNMERDLECYWEGKRRRERRGGPGKNMRIITRKVAKMPRAITLSEGVFPSSPRRRYRELGAIGASTRLFPKGEIVSMVSAALPKGRLARRHTGGVG